jgi:hypothetical protein
MTMADKQNDAMTEAGRGLEVAVERINEALQSYSDRDWNYSRIRLLVKPLRDLNVPYVMRVEVLDLATKDGLSDRKALVGDVKWGERHSSELGVLELVSLRINKALLEATGDQYWQLKRPVIRIIKNEVYDGAQPAHVLWYEVIEVAGEDFDNR